MKRYNEAAGTEGSVIEATDGEYILYVDHVEAMKRIAGDSGQQAEPVAWHIGNPDGTMNKIGAIYQNHKSAMDHFDSYGGDFNSRVVPLYAAPAPIASPAALTGDDHE